MAKLTDKEKADLIAGGVESTADETPTEKDASTEQEPEDQEVKDKPEETPEEASEEAEAEPETPLESKDSTFTKQFPNLKGESPEEYSKELETAYVNSTNEALRLKKELDDNRTAIEEAKRIIATQANPAQGTPPANPSALEISTDPNVQYAKQLRDKDMVSAFDDFTKQYPQAREAAEFEKFSAASNGVALGYQASHNGLQPSFPELYAGIAAVLGWQPITVTSKKDAAIKDAASSSQVTSSAVAPGRRPKVTDAQVDAYLKMFTTKSRADAIKELSEVVA